MHFRLPVQPRPGRCFLLCTLLCGSFAWGAAPRQKPPQSVVDAGKHASLQAAFDAVPAGGGLVQLPPGTFEIREPLVLTTGDTCVTAASAPPLIL